MPDIIRLLPDSVANQIAAGEVVQRPASAVKELVENSIDAGADKISLIVKEGGKALIQVIDNGCGMSVTDARMCFERHATSKIRKADDLFAIRTMGFRGEAMASIAAIAHVELRTRHHDDELGTCILIEGSSVVSQEPIACPAGTSISIKNLFYNIPARRNFLKGNPVELRHIIDEFQRLALAHPELFFSLHHDGNEVFHLVPGNLKQRIVHLFGGSYNQKLVPVEESTSIIGIRGFVGKPEFARKTRGEQFFFINNRFIKDAYLNHAVLTAYEDILPEESYPLYVLFIEIDPSKIDINVHPTKTEVKYQDEKSVYAIVRSAVKRSLGRFNISPSLDFNQESGFSQMITPIPPGEVVPPAISFNPDFNPFETEKKASAWSSQAKTHFPAPGGQDWSTVYEIAASRPEVSQVSLLSGEEHPADAPVKHLQGRPVFQLLNRFLASPIKSGLLLIDQQAAHERILYERFTEQLENRQGASQQSLFPKTITLTPPDFTLALDLLPDIEALGFRIRQLGKNTLIVEGIPAEITSPIREEQMLEQLIEGYKNNHALLKFNKRDNLARALAKNAAIRSGTPLTQEEMNTLIDHLFACITPDVSLQGKPVILTFTLAEILQKFER
jgi:DNA mismatch repair protein MutL